MKKALVGILLLVLLLTGCTPSNRRLGEVMLKRYSNDQNYVALSGEILECNSGVLTINAEGIADYISYADTTVFTYVIYSPHPLELAVGDTIEFITVPFHYFNYNDYNLPIVGVKVGDITLLDFEDGKEALLESVRKMRDS